mgnify:CR=1 FL=1
MIILEGYNDFYEGWLCGLSGHPLPVDVKGMCTQSNAFSAGYHTAMEIPPAHRDYAITAELKLSHIKMTARFGSAIEIWHHAEAVILEYVLNVLQKQSQRHMTRSEKKVQSEKELGPLLSKRTRNVLNQSDYWFLSQLVEASDYELLCIRNIGRKSLLEIRIALVALDRSKEVTDV